MNCMLLLSLNSLGLVVANCLIVREQYDSGHQSSLSLSAASSFSSWNSALFLEVLSFGIWCHLSFGDSARVGEAVAGVKTG